MSNLAKDRLMELIGDENKVNAFLETVEVRNRSIENDGLITREGEEKSTSEVVEAEAQVETPEVNSGDIIIDEETLGVMFSQFQPQVALMIEEAVKAERSRQEKEVLTLQNRIAELEKEDGQKVREAVEDMPESRKRNIVYRPSQQKLRDNETGEEVDQVEAIDVKDQVDKMLSQRRVRLAPLANG